MGQSVTQWVTVRGGISIIAPESGEVRFHNTPNGTKAEAESMTFSDSLYARARG
jgi:hypothetical protein